MRSVQALVTLFAALATSVHGHGAMVAVTGANGITAIGMGIDTSTPRDGTRRNPFQQDTSIIRDNEIASGEAGPCGRTLAGGVNDVAASVEGKPLWTLIAQHSNSFASSRFQRGSPFYVCNWPSLHDHPSNQWRWRRVSSSHFSLP